MSSYWILLLELFLTFFKIGLFTFGGGYAMIPLMRDEVVSRGWLPEEQVFQFIGISESTPGVFAINMATFVGTQKTESYGVLASLLGGAVATFGVVLPSFIIILIIAYFFKQFSENKYIKAAIKGVQPVVIGLIGVTALMLFVKNIFPSFNGEVIFSLEMLTITLNVALLYYGYLFYKKKTMSPIVLIFISALIGLVVFI